MVKTRKILNAIQFTVLPVCGFSTSPSPNEELSPSELPSSGLSGTVVSQLVFNSALIYPFSSL